MKKGMLSLLCVLVLFLTVLPVTARAAGESITVGGQILTYRDAPVSRQFGSGTATWDGSTLTLNDVNLDNADVSNDPGIDYSGSSPIVIELTGANLVSNFSIGIKSTQGITIIGAGSLIVSANTYGISTDGDLRIGDEGPTINADATGSGVDVCAINAGGNVEISGGTVTANCKTTVTDRALNSYGIAAGKNIVISGGTVEACSESTGETFSLNSYGIAAGENMIISDGEVTANGFASGSRVQRNYGIKAIGATISGGTVTAKTNGEGILNGAILTTADTEVTVEPGYGYQINVFSGMSESDNYKKSYVKKTEMLSFSAPDYVRITTTVQDPVKITVGDQKLFGSPLAPAEEEIGGGTVFWDSNTLKLENVTVESKDSSGIKYEGDNTITLELAGVNSVTGKYCGIAINNLVICGDGELTAEGGSAGIRVGYYFGATGTITFSGGTVIAKTQTSDGKGIYAFDNSAIIISGGVVKANTQATGSQGIYAGNGSTITISDGTVTAHTEDENGCGIRVGSRGKLEITDGTVIVDTCGHGICARDDGTLDIAGGTVNVSSANRLNYGIWGYTVNIMGGTVTSSGFFGIAVDLTGLTIGGGTITASGKWQAIGSRGGFDITVAPPENKHITARYGADENNTTTDVFTYTARKTYGDLYFHSEVTEPIPGGGETVITAMSISPGDDAVIPAGGNAKRFTAQVDCTGYVDDRVTWSVSGSTNPRTTISQSSNDGLLVVASDETATRLTVRATSVADPEAFCEVTIIVEPYEGEIAVGDVKLSGSVVDPAYAKTTRLAPSNRAERMRQPSSGMARP